jgi:hypothetical protein
MANLVPGRVFGQQGKPHLLSRLPDYNAAARFSKWFALCDLDNDEACAPTFVEAVLPVRSSGMIFRVAVAKVEAWLLGDRRNLSAFLGVPMSRIPLCPETVEDPKRLLVQISARSRYPRIREGIVPRPGSRARTGPGYTGFLMEFVQKTPRGWDPSAAAERCGSLAKCLDHLRRVARQ